MAPRPERSIGASGLVAEVESGDRVRTLLALRRHVAERVEEGVPARDLATLSLRLMQITEELEALDPDDAGPSDDDRRARRRAAALPAAPVDGAAVDVDPRA